MLRGRAIGTGLSAGASTRTRTMSEETEASSTTSPLPLCATRQPRRPARSDREARSATPSPTDTRHSLESAIAVGADEKTRDLPSGAQSRPPMLVQRVGQPFGLAAVHRDQVDVVEVGGITAHEGQPLAVGREDRPEVAPRRPEAGRSAP